MIGATLEREADFLPVLVHGVSLEDIEAAWFGEGS